MKAMLTLFTVCLVLAGLPARAVDRAVTQELQALLTAENETRAKLDSQLIEALSDMQKTKGSSNQADYVETSLLRAETRVSDLKTSMTENHLRIEFFNSFIAALENAPGDARTASASVLLDLAHKEIVQSLESNNEARTWLFEIYLSIALRDIMEPTEKFSEFVKNYVTYSTLKDPRSPSQFAVNRNYIGGSSSPIIGPTLPTSVPVGSSPIDPNPKTQLSTMPEGDPTGARPPSISTTPRELLKEDPTQE